MSNPDLTPDALKQQFDKETVQKAQSFKTHGVSRQTVLDYLETPEGKLHRQRLIETAPNTPLNQLTDRAIDQITSGVELPRMETLNEPLVKIVPKGIEPSPYSPF